MLNIDYIVLSMMLSPYMQPMIELDTPIEDVLNRYPELASLFVHHHMICVGCAIARFHSVREAAVMYHLDPDRFLGELRGRTDQTFDS